jgi:hypothetical protein
VYPVIDPSLPTAPVLAPSSALNRLHPSAIPARNNRLIKAARVRIRPQRNGGQATDFERVKAMEEVFSGLQARDRRRRKLVSGGVVRISPHTEARPKGSPVHKVPFDLLPALAALSKSAIDSRAKADCSDVRDPHAIHEDRRCRGDCISLAVRQIL